MNTLDFSTKAIIESSIERIEEILTTGVLVQPTAQNHIFHNSAFIELLILLRDLMYKTESYATRVSFTYDVLLGAQVKDVTDLIKYMRDALCHRESNNHVLDKTRGWTVTFCSIRGKGSLARFGDLVLQSEYSDDICYFFGAQKIYLFRHIIRAFQESKAQLLPLL